MGANQLLPGRPLQEDGESRLCLRRAAEDWGDSESSAGERAVTAWVTAAGEGLSSRNRRVGPAQLASSCSPLCLAFFLLAFPGCILHSRTLSSNIFTISSVYYMLSELPRVVSAFLLTVAHLEWPVESRLEGGEGASDMDSGGGCSSRGKKKFTGPEVGVCDYKQGGQCG